MYLTHLSYLNDMQLVFQYKLQIEAVKISILRAREVKCRYQRIGQGNNWKPNFQFIMMLPLFHYCCQIIVVLFVKLNSNAICSVKQLKLISSLIKINLKFIVFQVDFLYVLCCKDFEGASLSKSNLPIGLLFKIDERGLCLPAPKQFQIHY